MLSVREHLQLLQGARHPDRGHGRVVPLDRPDRGARRLRPADDRPNLLEELARATARSSASSRPTASSRRRPSSMDEKRFRWEMNEDAMATEMLSRRHPGLRPRPRRRCATSCGRSCTDARDTTRSGDRPERPNDAETQSTNRTISTRSPSTPSARSRWTPCRPPTPAIPARRWPWRRWPTALAALPALRPAQPIWPNRDRFVLSVGHASMLLYALLHLAGVKAVNPDYETLGEPVGAARRHQALPPARQPLRRPSRVPLDHRRRDHHRPARPGRRHQRRHGDRRSAGSPRPTTGPASSSSTTTSTPSPATAT